MLSKKTRYALLALAALARHYEQEPVPIGAIAQQEHIPHRFLEGILLELKNAGLLRSTRGKTGGYSLAEPPSNVSLDRIVTLFEGSVGMLACICDRTYRPCEFCKDETTCKIRETFRRVYENTVSILKNTTLQDLIQH